MIQVVRYLVESAGLQAIIGCEPDFWHSVSVYSHRYCQIIPLISALRDRVVSSLSHTLIKHHHSIFSKLKLGSMSSYQVMLIPDKINPQKFNFILVILVSDIIIIIYLYLHIYNYNIINGNFANNLCKD